MKDPKWQRISRSLPAALVMAWLVIAPALVRANAEQADFTYAGGTESIQNGCEGKLELADDAMTFQCPQASVTIPYHSITRMEYRPKVSRAVRRMKLPWKVKPSGSGGKSNLFFTVLFNQGGSTQAIVLRVLPREMRPYLAQIELSTGKRIAVWDYRGYD
ncbi:MAG: hypothetical protein ACRD2B_06300 [Terriglobia bacterium]